MAKITENSRAGRHKRKPVAIALAAIAALLLVVTLVVWFNLPDEDPGEPMIEDVGEEVSEVAE